MYKYFLSISLVLVVLVVAGAGCSNTASTNTQDKSKETYNNQNASSTERMRMPGIPGNVSDLKVGKKVLVWGTVGSDATVTAQRIMIGDSSVLPVGLRGQHGEFSSSTTSSGSFANNNRAGNQPVRRNFNGQLRNGSGSTNGGAVRARNSTVTMINGEILKEDSNSLVIKTEDGGSKIVFFTEKTEILLPELSTGNLKLTTSTSPKIIK